MQSRAQVRLFGHDVVVPPNTDVWNLSNSHKMGLQKKALFWLTWEPVFSKQGFEMVAFEEEQSLKGSATTVEKDEVACRILDEASVCIRLRVRHDPDERTTYLLGMRTSQDAKVALSCGFSEADEASRATCKTIFEIQEHPEAGRELLQEP
jgi:hypothetical protein